MSQLGNAQSFHRPPGSGARNENERIVLIVNPRAGAGRAGRELDNLRRAADRAFAQAEVQVTEGPGHAIALASAAAESGADIVAAVGGDGTSHEVVNGLFAGDRPRNRKTAFTVVPFGTGSDLPKTLRMPSSLSDALWLAATGVTLPSDVGHVSLAGPDGPKTSVFINVAGFGTNGEVVRIANDMDKRWGGRATFILATLKSTRSYVPTRVRIEWSGPQGDDHWEGVLTSCFVGNAAYCGGGMWVGRGGTMQDGLFDVTILPPSPLARQLWELRRLYDGQVERMKGAVRVRATALRATVLEDRPMFIDLDGEMPGRLPVAFRVLPGALNVRGGWIHNPHLAT